MTSRVLGSVAVAGLAALCQCSFLFDLGGITAGDGGQSDAGDLSPADDGGGEAGALDAADDGEGGAGGFDATVDAASDTGLNADGGTDGAAGLDAADSGGAVDGSGGGLDGADGGGDGAGGLDAADGGGDGAGAGDAADGAGDGAGGVDAADGAVDFTVGLVAFYPFSETSGTTSADATGNGHTATMQGATFALGLTGNAATLSGTNQYVILPNGIASGLTSFSIATWVRLAVAPPLWSRIFDFGTGTTAYMFLSPNAATGLLRFAITTAGLTMEQQLSAPMLVTVIWQHVAVTLTGTTGTLYANGVQVAQNTAMTLNPASLGATTQNWLGRSEFTGDPYMNGQIDNFRLYNRALSASEVQQLFQQRQ